MSGPVCRRAVRVIISLIQYKHRPRYENSGACARRPESAGIGVCTLEFYQRCQSLSIMPPSRFSGWGLFHVQGKGACSEEGPLEAGFCGSPVNAKPSQPRLEQRGQSSLPETQSHFSLDRLYVARPPDSYSSGLVRWRSVVAGTPRVHYRPLGILPTVSALTNGFRGVK